jgi:hypothetical protein
MAARSCPAKSLGSNDIAVNEAASRPRTTTRGLTRAALYHGKVELISICRPPALLTSGLAGLLSRRLEQVSR